MSANTEIENELSRIEESATWSGQGQFEQAKLWRSVHLVLGAPAAVLAAVTGGTLLADAISVQLAGYLALVSAGLGALVAALGAGQRSATCEAVGNRYLAVQGEARRARQIDAPNQGFDEARAALAELTKTLDEINAEAPVISRYAHGRARKNIEGGSQTYKVDRG